MSLSWSYSAYSSATRCLRLYQHQFIDRTKPDYDSGDMAFGSALHSAINSSLIGDDGEITFEIYWNTYKDKDLVYGRHKWPELKELGLKFVKNFKRLHAKKYELKEAEKRLSAEYRGIVIEGTPDFIGLYNSKTALRDFKTSGSNYSKDKEKCAIQLNLYIFLAKENGHEFPETLGYTVFNKGTGTIQDLTWEFSKDKMYEALDNFVDMVETWDLDNNDGVYPKNLNSCLDYNRRCQYWSKCHGGTNET